MVLNVSGKQTSFHRKETKNLELCIAQKELY